MNVFWLILVRMIYVGLTWATTKLGVETTGAQLDTASTVAAGVIATGIGLAIESLAPKFWTLVKAKFSSPPVPGLLMVAAIMGAAMVFGLGGCSNMTPNQRYKLDAAGYDISVIGFSAADAAGKVPAAAKPPAAIAFADAKQRLSDAYAWLTANPTLANTPGISPPSLDALDIATDAVRAIVRNYLLASPLVPINPPTTQPATTQPVPIPIPG